MRAGADHLRWCQRHPLLARKGLSIGRWKLITFVRLKQVLGCVWMPGMPLELPGGAVPPGDREKWREEQGERAESSAQGAQGTKKLWFLMPKEAKPCQKLLRPLKIEQD